MKALITTLIFVLVTNLAFAQDTEKKKDRNQQGERLKKELGLTDEQMAKIRELRKSKKDDGGQGREKMRESRESFKKAMKDPKVSNEELKKKFETFQQERNTFQRNRFEHMLQMRSILTPEQMEKFHQMRKEKMGKGHKGESKGEGRHQGRRNRD